MNKRILLMLVVLVFVGNMMSCNNDKPQSSQETTLKNHNSVSSSRVEASISTGSVTQTTPIGTTSKVWSNSWAQTTTNYQFVYKPKRTIDVDKLPPLNDLKFETGVYPDYFISKPEYKEHVDSAQFFEDKLYTDKNHPDFVISNCKGGICINQYIGKSKKVVIPDEIGGKKVVRLGGYYATHEEVEDGYYYVPFWNHESPYDDKTNATELVLSKYLKYIEGDLEGIHKFAVDSDNPYYSSLNGVLYSKISKFFIWYLLRCRIILKYRMVLSKYTEKLSAKVRKMFSSVNQSDILILLLKTWTLTITIHITRV